MPKPSTPAPLVLTVGEALVDWVSRERGAGLAGATSFTKAFGGAPLNVAVGLARLGISVGFCGCLGDDAFGEQIAALLTAEGIDATLTRRVAERQTRMAYVVTREDGDRELAAFSRLACADEELGRQDLPVERLEKLGAFYFGSLPLVHAASGDAILLAAARVRASGGLVVFDPNMRPVLWPDANKLLRAMRNAFESAHLVKLGADELLALTGTDDLAPGVDRLLAVHPLDAVLVTYGQAGAGVRTRTGVTVQLPAPVVPAQDATGAGDGFVAGVLAAMADECGSGERLTSMLERLSAEDWERVLGQANAVGAMSTTKQGAIAALPTRAELEAFRSMSGSWA